MAVDWLQHIPRWMFTEEYFGADCDWWPVTRCVQRAFVATMEEIPFALNAWVEDDELFIEAEDHRMTRAGLQEALGWDCEVRVMDYGDEVYVSTPDLFQIDGPRLAANTHILMLQPKRTYYSPCHLFPYGPHLGTFSLPPRRFPVPRSRMQIKTCLTGRQVYTVIPEDVIALYGQPPFGEP